MSELLERLVGLDCSIGDLLVALMCANVAQLKLEMDISDVDWGSVSIYVHH